MSDASQGMYSDPNFALQLATLSAQQLVSQQQQQDQQVAEQNARKAKSGFFGDIMGAASKAGHSFDGAMSHVPGWGITKDVGKVAWYPVDKLASGAYWLYSNGVSQPLSTLFLMAATSQGGGIGSTSYFSGHDWASTWHKANDISPGQAVANYENTMEAKGNPGILGDILGTGGKSLSPEEKKRVSQQADRFIYDTDYWRDKGGWAYTLGTGALDFMTTVGLDPSYAALKVGSSAVKGLRSVKVADETIKANKGIRSTYVDALSNKISQGLAKTPEQAAQSKSIQKFFDWTDGKTAAEIAQHPIWGRGRRVNPAKDQLSQILSNADDIEKPMIMRFAMGDNAAAKQLAVKNSDLLSQIGRMSDNRQLVDSVKYDPALFEHFMNESRAGRESPASVGGPGIGGLSSAATPEGRLVEPPYPRPTTPGPRQSGWDAMYGNLSKQSQLYRQATSDVLKTSNGVRAMGGAAGTSLADALRFDQWRGGRLTSIDNQIGVMKAKSGRMGELLNGAFEDPKNFTPGSAKLFGTTSSLYRMGPLALRDTEAGADKSIKLETMNRRGSFEHDGNLASRVLHAGFYSVPLRIVQSFGDRLPTTLVNHNDADASDRVLDMLKQVPGLGQEVRLGMLNAYSSAPDKVAKSAALKQIHQTVVEHMAQGKNLSYDAAKAIGQMIDTGTTDAYNQLIGKPMPKSQIFSAAKNPETGKLADKYEDGEAWIISPIAKTQLQYAEPLLNVKELGRFLNRNSGYLRSLKASGGRMLDGVEDVTDGLSNVWKAATLLRPGYILRAPSEEMAASAIKFGLTSSIMDSVHGGANWARNRGQQVYAVAGKGSYTSTITGKTRLRIVDPAMEKITKDLKLSSTRLKISDAWPVVMDRIDGETKLADDLSSQIAKMEKKTDHDPTELQSLKNKLADHQDVIAEHTDYAHELLRNATDAKGRRLGEGTIEHRGVEVPQAFSKEWDNPIPRDQISSDSAMHTLFARGEAIDTGRLIKTGSWTSITKDDPNYWPSMLDALNKQWGQDDLFKLVAKDPTLKAAQAWLRTPAGRMHLSQLGGHGRDPETLLSGVKATLNQYTAANPVLLDKISKGEKITEADVRGAIHEDHLPVVHGEEIKALTSAGRLQTATGQIDNMIEKGFRRLGTIPTDLISRHPTYLRAQEARMRQLIDQELSYQKSIGGPGDSIDPKKLNGMLEKSDTLARKDISQIVYDPTRTTATQALRFITPFLSAHMDGLERWAGLVAEQPQFLGRAAKIYNAPVAANLVTDSEGNHVDENGYVDVRDAKGKIVGRKFVSIKDRIIHFKTPPGTRGIVGALTGTNGKEIPIKIQALNTITPGDPWWNPGTGPIVQVAASQLALKNPAVGDFLQWAKVLPYGPQGTMESFTPKYMKDAWTAYQAATGNEDGQDFQKTLLAEYQRQVADHANGGPPPDIRKAEKNAKKFSFLKAFTSWVSPAQTSTTPLTGTPYQFYIDQYKKMQQTDPKNADENFFNRYGEDYFAFTTSLSKSIGIAPTVSALNTSKEYKDLIAGDPSLAGFVVGDVYNKGDFSSSAYAAEQNMTIGGQKVRSTQSVQDALADNQRRLGWIAYGKFMNQIDSSLIRSGFTSYTQKGAEQFLQAKQATTAFLKQSYPSWEEDFDVTDRGAVSRRIQSFQILVNDPRLKNDPMRQDIPALTQYLQARAAYKTVLAARGSSQLSFDVAGHPTGNNSDLAASWRQFQLMLVNSNTKFADVYNRYLSNDDLQ